MSSLQVLPERTNTAPLHAHLIRVQTSHEGCPWWWTFGLCVEPDDEVVFGIAPFKLEHKMFWIKTCWGWLPPWPDLPVLGLGWKEGLCLDERIFAISTLLHIFWGKLREAPTKMSPLLFGHCPNCDCTPPPHSNGHSGALYFRTNLSNFVKSPFWWW